MRIRSLGTWTLAGLAVAVVATALGAGLGMWDATCVERATPTVDQGQERLVVAPPTLVGRADTVAGPAAGPADVAEASSESNEPSNASASDEVAPAPDFGDDAHMRDGFPLTASHPLVAPVIRIQNRYTNDLMRHPLVVGTATGMNEDGEITILVLAKAEIHDLPSSIEGVPLMIHVTGEIFASKGPPPGKGPGNDDPPVDTTARFDRPVPIGVSTGHPDITAGTIGCRVVDTDGNFFALSNNHVYANENLAAIGDAVIQPGTYDGGTSPDDDIGGLGDFVTLEFKTVAEGGANRMDAAIADTTSADLGNSTPEDGYGTPLSTTYEAAINLLVRKYGRTTGETTGRVSGINASVNVGYSTGVAGFVGQVLVGGSRFSKGGDSGSLIVVQEGDDADKPVGLLFAGSSNSTIFSPIDPILTRFGVTVDGD